MKRSYHKVLKDIPVWHLDSVPVCAVWHLGALGCVVLCWRKEVLPSVNLNQWKKSLTSLLGCRFSGTRSSFAKFSFWVFRVDLRVCGKATLFHKESFGKYVMTGQ